MYHLPLLPGYGPGSNIRSSAPPQTAKAAAMQSRMSEAEENGYQGTYFTADGEPSVGLDGFISTSPADSRNKTFESEAEGEGAREEPQSTPVIAGEQRAEKPHVVREFLKPPEVVPVDEDVGEVVFFDYGVVVFFGLEEGQERSILDDLASAEVFKRLIVEDDWEIEECHFEVHIIA
jgi:uncharacterized Rmd1/YagE family protein